MKTFAIFSIFAIISLVSAAKNLYHIQSFLGDAYFHPVNGTLKLYVHRSGWGKDFLRLNETRLMSGKTYISPQFLNQKIHQINNLTFYWTLSKPGIIFNPRPSIILKGIKIIPTYLKDPADRMNQARSFCPKNARTIKHKEEVKLARC